MDLQFFNWIMASYETLASGSGCYRYVWAETELRAIHSLLLRWKKKDHKPFLGTHCAVVEAPSMGKLFMSRATRARVQFKPKFLVHDFELQTQKIIYEECANSSRRKSLPNKY